MLIIIPGACIGLSPNCVGINMGGFPGWAQLSLVMFPSRTVHNLFTPSCVGAGLPTLGSKYKARVGVTALPQPILLGTCSPFCSPLCWVVKPLTLTLNPSGGRLGYGQLRPAEAGRAHLRRVLARRVAAVIHSSPSTHMHRPTHPPTSHTRVVQPNASLVHASLSRSLASLVFHSIHHTLARSLLP